MKGNITEKKFVRTYEKHNDAIFRHCFFRVNDRELAVDLMQQTFTKTWTYIVDGNDIDNLKAFLYKTATNLVIDHYKKKKDESLEKYLDDGVQFKGEEDKESIEKDIFLKEVVGKIDGLGVEYKDIMKMRYMEGLKPKEIAKILSMSESLVSVRIHRGIKRMKEMYE